MVTADTYKTSTVITWYRKLWVSRQSHISPSLSESSNLSCLNSNGSRNSVTKFIKRSWNSTEKSFNSKAKNLCSSPRLNNALIANGRAKKAKRVKSRRKARSRQLSTLTSTSTVISSRRYYFKTQLKLKSISIRNNSNNNFSTNNSSANSSLNDAGTKCVAFLLLTPYYKQSLFFIGMIAGAVQSLWYEHLRLTGAIARLGLRCAVCHDRCDVASKLVSEAAALFLPAFVVGRWVMRPRLGHGSGWSGKKKKKNSGRLESSQYEYVELLGFHRCMLVTRPVNSG